MAHVALYLLLTAGARRDVATVEARFGDADLQAAVEPGPRPAGVAALATWHRSEARWEARRTWDAQRRFVSGLGFALLASFVIQTGLTVVVLYRSATGRRR
ncbi:MAG: hypothetical protein ACC662_04605 [Planctomycetota bacterium]